MNTKQELAQLLWRLAELERANTTRRSFASRAYRNAVWSLDYLPPELSADRAELMAVPRIGRTIADMIIEFLDTGQLGRLNRLAESLPLESGRLSRLPRMTPARLKALKRDLGVESVADLEKALSNGQSVSGIGDGTAEVWAGRLSELAHPGLSIPFAAGVAERFRSHLETHLPHLEFEIAGGVARLDDWVQAVELRPSGFSGLAEFLAQSALVIDMHPRPLMATTLEGKIGFVTDAEIPFVGASLQPQDLRGDFHVHSDWSPDGRQSMESILDTGTALGYEYLAITDHGMGLRFGGLRPDDVLRQRSSVQNLRTVYPGLLILQGAELNIDRDGNLDYDDEVLELLDFRLAGVHSNFGLERADQTERVIKAIRNPLVHAIAHLTGRRIGTRPPIDLDLTQVFAAAASHSTALEVNGHIDRLDVSAANAALAAEVGVLFLVNSDAHRPSEFSNVRNGVKVLQRAGVAPEQVINTWDVGQVVDWLALKNRSVNQPTK
jgi:histidinol phosphatase-like PHP family hydrolase